MTEPVAAPSQIYNAPMASTLTPEAAGARRAELLADADYCNSAIAGDVSKQEMLRDLWLMERGHRPASLAPTNIGEVYANMSEREIELDQQRVATWSKFISDWDDQKQLEATRGLATQQQHDEAVRELARMKSDGAFARKVLAGDKIAGDAWARANLVASMRIAPDDYNWNAR
jgi:hypothetical protein